MEESCDKSCGFVCRFKKVLVVCQCWKIAAVVFLCIGVERLFSTAKITRLKNTASLRFRKRRLLTCALFAHELNNFQSSNFVQLFNFKERFQICSSVKNAHKIESNDICNRHSPFWPSFSIIQCYILFSSRGFNQQPRRKRRGMLFS